MLTPRQAELRPPSVCPGRGHGSGGRAAAIRPPPKRSVLEPMTPRWLDDDESEPPKAATSPQTLSPDILSPPTGPAPESIARESRRLMPTGRCSIREN